MSPEYIEAYYFVQYPGYVECGLKCPYCFHKEAWDLEKEGKKNTKYKDQIPFTFEDYQRWRDKFLPDATKFLMEIHSGEISYGKNKEHCLSIIDKADKETFQLQTNGMGSKSFYEELIKRKNKIDRIGFTFHRKVIMENKNKDKLAERFIQNVFLIAKSGIKVIVKELLILSLKSKILESKAFWENIGIEFRIQDFRDNGGFDPQPYTPEELSLIHPEYLHGRENCSCRVGYKNVIIRGCDIFGGNVLACWHDPCIIGHIGSGYKPPEDYILPEVSDADKC